jgi:predicted lipoprotein with Yx(FWY)xxD motif
MIRRMTKWGAAALIVAALGAAGLGAAACGGGMSSGDKTATAAAGSPATPAAAPTAAVTKAASTAAATSGSGTTGAATVNIAKSGDPRFVDAAGMTLYEFQKDTANTGKSACISGCTSAWPPLSVPAGTTPTAGAGVDSLAVITRDDGTFQVTYDGLPLYHFATDKAAGDENGKAVANWMLAIP